MDTLLFRVAGLDIHKKFVMACVRITDPQTGVVKQEVKRFDTMTDDLRRLRDWLVSLDVTDVAMECTGVYWKPIVLEDTNIKLSSVASDVLGKSGRLMLDALVKGQTNPLELAKLAQGRLREKFDLLQRALDGHAGLCPTNEESAGKRKRTRIKPGDKWLKSALVESARSAGRTKDSYFKSQYSRLAARRGANRAAIAVAHSLLTVIYHVLSDPVCKYQDLGASYFDELNPAKQLKYHVKRLQNMGFKVELTPLTVT